MQKNFKEIYRNLLDHYQGGDYSQAAVGLIRKIYEAYHYITRRIFTSFIFRVIFNCRLVLFIRLNSDGKELIKSRNQGPTRILERSVSRCFNAAYALYATRLQQCIMTHLLS